MSLRSDILGRFREKLAKGEPIIGAGAGTGISAKCEEVGGVDLIIIYNSGRFRMAGRGSLAGMLPFGNANQIVREMVPEVLTVVERTPVLAGVCGTDPFLLRDRFLRELRDFGIAGVQNFPTVGLIDGNFRANLEETGLGYRLEVELIAAARSLDLITTPYAFNVIEAKQMAEAGADIVVAHGFDDGGSIGAQSAKTLDECIVEVRAIAEVCKLIRPECLVLCHGGPISAPDDARYVLERCREIDGFYGASSMERLPAEVAIVEQVRRFTTLRLPVVRVEK